MRRSASRRGIRSKRSKSFPRIPSGGTDRSLGLGLGIKAGLSATPSSPPRRPRKGGMGGGLSDAMSGSTSATATNNTTNNNTTSHYDPTKESVSLSALRSRSRRAPKREKSKLQFLSRAPTKNDVHAVPPTSVEDHKAAVRYNASGNNTNNNDKNDVLFIALESLYPTAAVMHTLLAGAFLNAPRSLRSTWNIPPIIAASAYASAKATGCEEVARRCLAISTSNGGNSNLISGGAAVAAAKELSRRLGAGLRISKSVRDRVNSLMTSSDVEWVVYAAALPVLLATSAAASRALLVPESCPCCGNRSGGFALAATAAALNGGYGIGRSPGDNNNNTNTNNNTSSGIKLPSLLGVPGNSPYSYGRKNARCSRLKTLINCRPPSLGQPGNIWAPTCCQKSPLSSLYSPPYTVSTFSTGNPAGPNNTLYSSGLWMIVIRYIYIYLYINRFSNCPVPNNACRFVTRYLYLHVYV